MKGVNVAFLLVGLLVVIVEGGSPRFDKTDHDKQINNKRERQARWDIKQAEKHRCLGGTGNGKKKSHLFKEQKKCLQRLSHGKITEKLIKCQCSLLGLLSNTYDNRRCKLLAPNEFVPGMDVNSGGEMNFKKKYKKYERRFQVCTRTGPYRKKKQKNTRKKMHSTFLEVASGMKTAKELSWGEVQGECKGMAASEVFENIPEECPNGDKSVQFDCTNNAKLCDCLAWVGEGNNAKFTSGSDYLTLAKENDEITYSISCSDAGGRRRRLLRADQSGDC